MRYKVWKADIENYRVLDTKTGEIQVLTDFTLKDCQFKIDINLYNQAKDNKFTNSGDENDYFAWIEANKVTRNRHRLVKKVFYNPFKSCFFKDRETEQIKLFANTVEITGNTLRYE